MKETKPQVEYTFTVLLEPAEEGGYLATCPALPGCITQGENLEQARQMAREAILGYLESLKKEGLPIPSDIDSHERVKEIVTVALDSA